MTDSGLRFAVVGGGVSGLMAARTLLARGRELGSAVEVTVFEADQRLGGRVAAGILDGIPVDLGAESLVTRTEVVWSLLGSLGIAQRTALPGTAAASIWNGRRLVPIPRGTALGVPLRPLRRDVVRAIGLPAAVRAAVEPWVTGARPDPDGAIGPLLRARLGSGVFTRLVDPLVGGVYAGSADLLSLGAVAPQLRQALDLDRSLLRGLRRQQARRETIKDAHPTFVSFEGGLTTLVSALQSALPASSVSLGSRVTGVRPHGRGVQLSLAGGRGPAPFDGIVLALPAPLAAPILQELSATLAGTLRSQEWASVATVSLSYPESALAKLPAGSGFLVPRSPRRVVTACTFMDRKWPHLRRGDRVLLRASVGSAGDTALLEMDDTTIVSAVHNSLRSMLPISGLPKAAIVRRWQPALPQYRVGQLAWAQNVSEQAASLDTSVVLTGASYSGVGIAACLQHAELAARSLFDRAATPVSSS